ncbi:MAG: xylose isomerase [Lentisphaerae bacterium]|nr:MAG: xylose isomerase [Lentisphaerota bacterium]
MLKQSFCLPAFPEALQDPVNFLQEVRKIGYAATEFWHLDANSEELFEIVRQQDLRIASFTGHQSIEKGMNNPDDHDRIVGELEKSIQIAARWQIPGVICFAGSRICGQSDFDGLRYCARALRRVLPLAREKNVNLNLELLNSRVDHFNYLGDHSAWGFALCELLDHPNAKVLYDIYHMQIMEGDLIASITRNIRYIGHFHTAGNPGRYLFDDTQELNYRGICRAIAETGYSGYLAHEFFPREGEDALDLLRRAWEICNV